MLWHLDIGDVKEVAAYQSDWGRKLAGSGFSGAYYGALLKSLITSDEVLKARGRR